MHDECAAVSIRLPASGAFGEVDLSDVTLITDPTEADHRYRTIDESSPNAPANKTAEQRMQEVTDDNINQESYDTTGRQIIRP